MKELPKELTPELLGLVLDEEIIKVDDFTNDEIEIHFTFYYADNFGTDGVGDPTSRVESTWINIDTLTRLMKEYLKSIDTAITVVNHLDCVACWLSFDDYKKPSGQFVANTEFKAVIKATHWVAKEKGYIK